MSNTVVVASDHNYVWGVYMMIASMRKNQMPEQVIVLAFKYTAQDKLALQSLGNVKIIDAEASQRNLTCSKADAMMLADSDYISWVDCDSFFTGNCSDKLICEDPDVIHIRQRTLEENKDVYKRLSGTGPIPDVILDVWRKDVGERSEARIQTCCSACFLSLHKKHMPFVKRWGMQMEKVLPKGNVGVVDDRSFAYFQTDESVLNSLLCFMDVAPVPGPTFKLDKDRAALYVHFISRPKPWVWWTPAAFRFFKEYTAVLDWAIQNKFTLPGEIPLPLRSDRYLTNYMLSLLSVPYRKYRTMMGRIKK